MVNLFMILCFYLVFSVICGDCDDVWIFLAITDNNSDIAIAYTIPSCHVYWSLCFQPFLPQSFI